MNASENNGRLKAGAGRLGQGLFIILVAVLVCGARGMALEAWPPRYGYSRFQMKVTPRYVLPNTFQIDIEAENISSETFVKGDVTLSFPGMISPVSDQMLKVEIVSHNATAIRRFPPGSSIYSVEKSESMKSEHLIIQLLEDHWIPGARIGARFTLTAPHPPYEFRVRVAGRLEEGKTIFEPIVSEKDQQGLYAERWFLEQEPLLADIDGDGSREIIVEWKTGEWGSTHQYQVYRAAEDAYELLGQFDRVGMPQSGCRIITEPDSAQGIKVVLSIGASSSAGFYYVLRPDGTTADKVITALNDEYVDLDGDGVNEWIFFQKFDGSQTHNRLGLRALNIEIFKWDRETSRYLKIWPELDADWGLMGAIVVDVDGDGSKEIAAIMTRGDVRDPACFLNIYKFVGGSMNRIAFHALPRSNHVMDIAAVQILGDTLQFIIQHGFRGTTRYSGCNYRLGRFQDTWFNEQMRIELSQSTGYSPLLHSAEGDEVTFYDSKSGEEIVPGPEE